jgi:hypothetical protein
MRTRFLVVLKVVIFILLNVSCSTSSGFSWKEEKAVIEVSSEELAKIIEQGKNFWNKRYEKQGLLKALNNFEMAFNAEQELPNIMTKVNLATLLSRGYYQLGDYHEKDQSLKMQAYKIGGEWAQRGFGLNKYFQTAIGERGHFAPGLRFLDKEFVGCLYWYLANIGKWALNSGVNTTIKYRALFYDISNRIIELDENYYGGGIYRILGAFYAVLPAYAGGNLDKSWEYFQKSLAIGPNYIGTKVLMAQAFAVYRNDLELFNRTLTEVSKTKLDITSDIYPENYLEQQKAQALHLDADNLFD